MTEIVLTQYSGAFLGPIAKLLGWVTDLVYILLSNLGIENIGLTIIVLTLVIYTMMLPLTYKQQKFSIMSQKMNPELMAIRKKYENKRDQESVMRMNDETKMVYEKYGVSPSGSCIQLLIQMPILFALYRVIYNVPAYVASVKEVFTPLVDGIMKTPGYQNTMAGLVETLKLQSAQANFSVTDTTALGNYIIDVIYKMSSTGWDTLQSTFPALSSTIDTVHAELSHINYFLGLNISDAPMQIITSSFKTGSFLMVLGAILIPLLSYITQVVNIKLMPQSNAGGDDAMAQQMKTMNRVMPIFSLVLCFTVPVGLGLYWIASALFRGIQQFVINKHLQKLDIDGIIKQNEEKAKKKREKMGIKENQISSAASMSTKRGTNLNTKITSEEKQRQLDQAYEVAKGARANSLTARANMVRDFNERNNK